VLFDISPLKLVLLLVLAVVVFGPDKLPKVVTEVMGFIRKIREFSESARTDIRKELGPEFEDFDFSDLHPRTFVKKNILDPALGTGGSAELAELRNGFDLRTLAEDVKDDVRTLTAPAGREPEPGSGRVDMTKREQSSSAPDEHPPFDPDAT
jgi:sec-independent protein translocase protein TatB